MSIIQFVIFITQNQLPVTAISLFLRVKLALSSVYKHLHFSYNFYMNIYSVALMSYTYGWVQWLYKHMIAFENFWISFLSLEICQTIQFFQKEFGKVNSRTSFLYIM